MLDAPFLYAKAVTPDNTADNINGAVKIQNTGTSGAFRIRQDSHDDVDVYLTQGAEMRVGHRWRGVKAAGLGAGVVIVAFY